MVGKRSVKLGRMETHSRKISRISKKKVNCSKPGFQLNPMCMNVRFSRKFVAIEKSMKKLRNIQSLEKKINFLEL